MNASCKIYQRWLYNLSFNKLQLFKVCDPPILKGLNSLHYTMEYQTLIWEMTTGRKTNIFSLIPKPVPAKFYNFTTRTDGSSILAEKSSFIVVVVAVIMGCKLAMVG